ncbi:hypothetical protein ACIBEJ_00295 [Nonomuraea sp. NPDC050790]|uniref:hypothetical protein n=1 Tax=Nonomuraea sp. NPDC050790 TaxID=3364371 RepID=UPI0037A02B65
MTHPPQGRPELVGLPDIARITGEKLNTLRSWRHREDYDKLPDADAIVSGTPVWLQARWTHPDEPLPDLPLIVGVKEVAAMFGVDPDTVTIWFQRQNGAPPHEWKIGKTRIWTLPPWQEFAKRTGRPITLPTGR